MKPLSALFVAFLAWSTAAAARPFETQAQIEARYGGRAYNGTETADYKIIGYSTGTMVVWVVFMNGISEGELFVPNGIMPDMEVASLLDANKGQSIWQIVKMEGSQKGTTAKAWNRKDGQLSAMMANQNNQGFFLIGTKRAERLMGDMKRLPERLRLRDRMQ